MHIGAEGYELMGMHTAAVFHEDATSKPAQMGRVRCPYVSEDIPHGRGIC